MADGGVDFAVRLVNNVTGPSKQIQRAMKDVAKAFDSAKKSVDAPMARRGAMSDWDKAMGKAKRSQAADFAREQKRLVRFKAAENLKAQAAQMKAHNLQAAEQSKAQKAKAIAEKMAVNKQIKEAKRVASFQQGMAQIKLDQQGGALDSLTGLAKGGAIALAVGAAAAAAAVGFLAFKFGEASVEAAAFGEKSRLALSFLIGNAPVAAAQFDAVRHEAQRLGLDVRDTQEGFQKLLAAQFEIGKAKELLRMAGDLQAIGASAEHTKRAIVAISQIKNTGYLQGDELNQLREAGVSTELVYEALGKRLNKTTAQIIQMQEKRQLGSTDVIESILEAVRKKTGAAQSGDTAKKFAQSTLVGMAGTFKSAIQNFFIDIGDAILPGITTIAKLVTGTFSKLANDPKIAAVGTFLLREFEIFVLWVEANWPTISDLFITSVQRMGDAIRFTTSLFDTGTLQGKIFAGIMGVLAVVLGLVAIACFLVLLPINLLLIAVGLLAFGIYKAVQWVVDALSSLSVFSGTPNGATPPTITTAADSGPSAGLAGILRGVDAEAVTVASEPTDKVAAGPVFNQQFTVAADVDQDSLATKIRSGFQQMLSEANV